ncbi:MAG TPA: helix-turn-helix transcriptional regulator [Streptosporangiaceae bacterium]
MNALQELIRRRMAELNRSYGEVARRGGLPRSTVYHLASNDRPVRVPSPRTLERLAMGLDIPESLVRAAAATAAGFVLDEHAAEDPEIEVLVASLARLSAQDRRHVAALVQSMLEAAAIEAAISRASPEGIKKVP